MERRAPSGVYPISNTAAELWNTAGAATDRLSQSLQDAIDHCILRLAPVKNERLLDIGCATGWATRSLHRRFPHLQIAGIDIASDLVDAAREFARAENLPIEYLVGPAEKLPFPDHSFDRVMSTFAIPFSSEPALVGQELFRVCKPGGHFAMTSWRPNWIVRKLFEISNSYSAQPAAWPPSSYKWSEPDFLAKSLSGFDFVIEEGISHLRAKNAQAVWDLMVNCHAPTKRWVASLDVPSVQKFRSDYLNFIGQFRQGDEICQPREYIVIYGVRK